MKKTLLISLLFCLLLTAAYAQNKSIIKNATAYFTVSIPGMARIDENGKKINPQPVITRFIYVEIKGKIKPFFDTISYNGSLFMSSVAIDSSKLKVGINKKDGMPIMLQAQKGNTIWRLDLQFLNDKQKTTTVNATNIIIKGKVEKTIFKMLIKREIELIVPDVY